MSDQSIFNGQEQSAPPAQSQQPPAQQVAPQETSITDFANLLSGIKNERGEQKYDSVEKALEGATHAQGFITQLTSEKANLEAEIASLKGKVEGLGNVDDIVAKLQAQKQEEETTPVPASLSAEDVAKLVANGIENNSAAQVSKVNTSSVAKAMQEAYGAEAEAKFYSKAQEMGMSPEAINKLAAASPQAVIALLAPKVDSSINPALGGNTSQFQANPTSLVKRREGNTLFNGATSQEILAESRASAAMVAELHASGKEMYDLSDPKEYFKHFGS